MPLVYAHEILSQCDIYFLNGGHFSKFLYLALLHIWHSYAPILGLSTGKKLYIYQ